MIEGLTPFAPARWLLTLAIILALALGLAACTSAAQAQLDPRALAVAGESPPWVWPASLGGKLAMASVFSLLSLLFSLVAGGIIVTLAWMIAWGIALVDRSEGTARDRHIKRIAVTFAVGLSLFIGVSTALDVTARMFV